MVLPPRRRAAAEHQRQLTLQTIPASAWGAVHLRVDLGSLAAGSHLLDFRVARGAGANYTDFGISIVFEELVRQTANNT